MALRQRRAEGPAPARRVVLDAQAGLRPILLARKPLASETPRLAANIQAHGTGALNIDATRLIAQRNGEAIVDQTAGRWPANVLLGHEPGCQGDCAAECAVAEIDRRYPHIRPSRYFYAAKASRAEREAGLDLLPKWQASIFSGGGAPRANAHPTVKPIGLMRWIVRLVVPPRGVVLDPFAGSGSTGCAAAMERRQFVGVERERAYVDIARARLANWAARAGKTATP